MESEQYQKTISKEVAFKGIGLHSGIQCEVKLLPAKADTGILFLRKDKDIYQTISADYKFISKSNLCTTLENFDSTFRVFTVEHLLAAIKGNGIDNLIIEVSSSEVPALDGSSIEFDRIIKKAGIEVQSEKFKKYLVIKRNVSVKNGKSYIELSPSNSFSIDCKIEFPEPIGQQQLKLGNSIKEIYNRVLNARTFCFYEDVESMKESGLAMGGSLENALVIKNKRVLNESGLRDKKEFVQHKILDMIGDLSLTGLSLKCSIKAYCPGHEINKLIMREIFSNFSNYSIETCKKEDIKNFKQEAVISAVF